MKFRFNNNYVRWGVTAFCVIAASICFYYTMFHGSNIKALFVAINEVMLPIVMGFVIAYLMTPILNQIEYRLIRPIFEKISIKFVKKKASLIRGISITITAIICFVAIYAIIAMFVSQIVPSIVNLVDNFDVYVENVINMINRLMENNPQLGEYATKLINRYSEELELWLNNTVLSATSEVIKTVSLSIINVLGVLWDGIIGFIISIYLMASKEKFAGQAKKIAYAFFSKDTANSLIRNFRFTHKTFSGFISGKVLDSLIIGLICFIVTTLMGTPYAALVSLIIGVTNVVPFFGPFLGGIPCSILVLLVDPMHPLNCVYFAVFIFLLQQFDGNILGPKILGDSTGLAGFWVIFSITLFGGMFGILGMIVGVPIFAVIYAAIKAMVHSSLEKKNMPKETAAYLTVESVDETGFREYIPEYKKNIEEQKQAREQKKLEQKTNRQQNNKSK